MMTYDLDTSLQELQLDLDFYIPSIGDDVKEKIKAYDNEMRVRNELGLAGLSTIHNSPQNLIFSGYNCNFVSKTELYEIVNRQTGEIHYIDNRPFFVKSTAGRVVKPAVTFWRDGRMIKVQRLRVKAERRSEEGFIESNRRGEIVGFSRSSRVRMMQRINSTDCRVRPLFVTLTYPDLFIENPIIWKRDIDVLGKRLIRRFSEVAFIWKLELKERLSGKNVGHIAPHFHLLLWGVSFQEALEILPFEWWKTVGSGDINHFRAGVRTEYIRSWSGIMFYTSKYIAKELEENFNFHHIGRFWGIVGRENIPWSALEEFSLTDVQACKFLRFMRRFRRIGGFNYKSLTIFCDPYQWGRVYDLITDDS